MPIGSERILEDAMVTEFKTRKLRIARGVMLLAAAAMLATFTQSASAHDDQGWYRPREHDWHSGWIDLHQSIGAENRHS